MSKWCTKEYLDKLSDDAKNDLIYQLLSTNEKLTEDINDLKEILRLKSTKPFIPSTEQTGYLFDEMELLVTALTEEEEKLIEVKEHSRKKAPHKVKELAADTPIIDVNHCEDANDEIVDENGYLYTRIEDKVVEKISLQPASYFIERHLYPQYKLKDFEADRKSGEKNIIVKWNNKETDTIIASSSLVSKVVTRKYNDQLPLYRQEAIFKRDGLEFSRQTLSNWLLRYFNLIKPLQKRLKYHILSSNLINQDETPVQVLKIPNSKPSTTHFMMVRVGVSNIDAKTTHKIVQYQYLPNRKKDTLNEDTKYYDGFIMTDGLKGYLGLNNHLNCWVHGIRQFKAILKINKKATDALIIVSLVNELYKEEKKLRKLYEKGILTKEAFNKTRVEKTDKIFKKIRVKIEEIKPKYTEKSAMGKAIKYLFEYWDTLIKYPKCFEATPDNNLAENSIRPFTLGRKNWLFSVSQQGVEASALYYSLVETAKANNINVYKYLNYVLEKAPKMKQETDWDQLLPWNVSKDKLENLVNRSNLAVPNKARTEKYIFRGAH